MIDFHRINFHKRSQHLSLCGVATIKVTLNVPFSYDFLSNKVYEEFTCFFFCKTATTTKTHTQHNTKTQTHKTMFYRPRTVKGKGSCFFLLFFFYIMITYPCNVYPLTPNFYIVKLGFTGVYNVFLFLLKT